MIFISPPIQDRTQKSHSSLRTGILILFNSWDNPCSHSFELWTVTNFPEEKFVTWFLTSSIILQTSENQSKPMCVAWKPHTIMAVMFAWDLYVSYKNKKKYQVALKCEMGGILSPCKIWTFIFHLALLSEMDKSRFDLVIEFLPFHYTVATFYFVYFTLWTAITSCLARSLLFFQVSISFYLCPSLHAPKQIMSR